MSTSTPTPIQTKWREISGLTVESEKTLQGSERRAAIRKLHVAAETEIRAELQRADEDAEFKGERSFLWEPTSAVCRALEISQSMLSRLLKELTGMTASQMADKIRAESLREKLRADLVKHIRRFHNKPGGISGSLDEIRHKFWKQLKFQRSDPSFSLATRAIELGFANYTRLYRACLLQYGKTPTQLEDDILDEIAQFFCIAWNLIVRRDADDYINRQNESYKPFRKPYSDSWADATQSRPEWLEKNRNEFGLSDEALKWL